MSPGPIVLRCADAEQLALYALHVLEAQETSIVEAHLSGCAQCRGELEELRRLVDDFAHWPNDVLRPSVAPWERLAKRLEEETGEPALPAPQPWAAEPQWEEVAPGIRCKLLATDSDRGRVSMLVRLAPGIHYPAHRHGGIEELHLLDGELWIGDRKLRPGDYNRAEPGTVDMLVWSETGCTCVLVTSTRDAIL
ncbi:MAG: cupin domain-containing protein [Steroidobacteraceae bacterium]